MRSKVKLDWFQFYARDWLCDPRLMAASLTTQGIWIRLLCLMFVDQRSELTGDSWAFASWSGARCDVDDVTRFMDEAQEFGFADVTIGNPHENPLRTVYTVRSRRLAREAKHREDTKEKVARYRARHAANQNSNHAETSSNPLVTDRVEKSRVEKSRVEKKENILSSADADNRLSVQDLVESWNDFATRVGFAKVTEINQERQRKIRARLTEHPSIEFWSKVLTNIELSNFLSGKTNGNGKHAEWRCNFDWLISNATVSVKVFEGGYNAQSEERR